MNPEQTNDVTAVTHDVLAHHLACLGERDLAGTMADYRDDAILFTPDGVLRGSAALRGFFAEFEEEVAGDTFIIRNGKIATQTFAGKISPKRP